MVTPARSYDADPLADLLGAADQVALLEAARLLVAQRRALERLEVLVELRGVEAADRLVVGAPDRARELGRDVDGGAVTPGRGRGAADVVHPARDLLRGEHGGHPALAVRAGAPPHLGVVAPRVHGQRRLPRLGEALHVLEAHVAAAVARAALGEEQAERAHALVDDVAAPGVARVGMERLVLLAVGAGADAQDDAPAGELVERGHLLGEHGHRAHRQHDDAGGEADALGARGHVRERDQRLVEVRRVGPLALDVALGGHVVVAPDGVEPDALGEERGGQDVLRAGEGHRVHHALDARGDVDAEPHARVVTSFQMGPSVRPMRATCSRRGRARRQHRDGRVEARLGETREGGAALGRRPRHREGVDQVVGDEISRRADRRAGPRGTARSGRRRRRRRPGWTGRGARPGSARRAGARARARPGRRRPPPWGRTRPSRSARSVAWRPRWRRAPGVRGPAR